MSNLSAIPIADLRKIFNLTAFIETGTEGGDGCDTAFRAGFRKIYSCEIDLDKYREADERFRDIGKICLLLGPSCCLIPKILDSIRASNILFWLDAHLPNPLGKKYESLPKLIYPLKSELLLIKEHCLKYNNNNVILIDDIDLLDLNSGDKDIDIDIEQIRDIFPDHNWYVWEKDKNVDGILLGFPISPLKKMIENYGWHII